jgi:hypothetical protein
VKQEWLPSLPEADRKAAAELLNRPSASSRRRAATVARLRRSLEAYLGARTEIVIP